MGFRVKDVVATSYENSVVIVQLEIDGPNKPAHYGQVAAMALQSRLFTTVPPKYIIVVGPDIDPYDLTDVMWAVGTRTMPSSDSIMIKTGRIIPGDPGGMVPGPQGYPISGEQMLIDATIKIPERYTKFPQRSEPVEWEKEAITRMEKKMD